MPWPDPQSWEEYWSEALNHLAKSRPNDLAYDHIDYYRRQWQEQEAEKAKFRREREKNNRLAAAADRELQRINERIARAETQKINDRIRETEKKRIQEQREQREAQRKQEQAAEKERRDPTPQLRPAHLIPQIPFSIRDQHVFVPGMTRHGKSSQMFHLILHDIANGRGVGVLDPIKGDLITSLLPFIPQNRLKDCIYLDLKHPIPLDVMRPTPYPEHLVGDIKQLILKGDTTLKRAEPILTRLIYALLALPGSKFTDIEDIFTLPKRKQWFLDSLEKRDPQRFEYWKANWPTGDRFEPLLSRMTDFTENPTLRVILGEPEPRLNLRKAMDERKIILVSLPGDSEVTQIYGTMLVSRFQQAAYSRADIPKDHRAPFCLYVDEFEMFQTPSFNKILQAAGGLGLYLTLGNQHIFQLSEDIRHSVFGNVGTCIIFKIREGFDQFATIIHPYKPYRLGLIPKHQAIFKVGDAPPVFHWTKKPPDFDIRQAEAIRQTLIRQTYAQYGQKRTVDNSPSQTKSEVHDEEDGPTLKSHSTQAPDPRKPGAL